MSPWVRSLPGLIAALRVSVGVDPYEGGINGEGSVIDDELRNIPEVQQKSEIGA